MEGDWSDKDRSKWPPDARKALKVCFKSFQILIFSIFCQSTQLAIETDDLKEGDILVAKWSKESAKKGNEMKFLKGDRIYFIESVSNFSFLQQNKN